MQEKYIWLGMSPFSEITPDPSWRGVEDLRSTEISARDRRLLAVRANSVIQENMSVYSLVYEQQF